MEVKIQLSDATYRNLLASGSRTRGSIGLVSPTEGNFNEYGKWRPASGTRSIKLPHGRASVGEKVRLVLSIDLKEDSAVPAEAIQEESRQASSFVDDMLSRKYEYL